MSTDGQTFIRQDVYVDAILATMRLRLRGAVEGALRGDASRQVDRDDEEAQLHDAARASAAAGVAMPLLWLGDRLSLTMTEQRALFVLLAHELDPTSRQLMRDLNTEQVSDPTLDAIRRVVYGDSALVRAGVELGPDGALRKMHLIERTDANERCPEHRQTFAISRRVLALALGDTRIDPTLAGLATESPSNQTRAGLVVDSTVLERVANAIAGLPGLIIVSSPVGSGRRSLLRVLAQEQHHDVIEVDCRAISSTRDVARRQMQTIAREVVTLHRVPLLCHLDALSGVGEVSDRIDLLESELSGLVLGTTTRPLTRRWQQPPTLIEMTPPTGAELAQLWARAIPEASDGDAELMATMYPLAPALIMAAGEVAHRQASGGAMSPVHIATGVRSVLDDRLAGLATRIKVTQSWDDIVLPDDVATSLVEFLARIRQRRTVYETWGFANKVGKGLGVSALLSGPPGTGKTMAAGLISKDLGVELYQVDLSKIVSKWIGETERNLASLFDAAEAGHAILLFDEADALFGKRTDVKSSNDRHANQEVNFLLQRMESFTGICILTTNHETAIDEAFRRRLSMHIRFPVPEVDERKALWRAMLPPNAPVAGHLDLDALAEDFEISGGYIRNAVLRAAFLAADSTGTIDAQLLARAAQLECEAMGKVVARRENISESTL